MLEEAIRANRNKNGGTYRPTYKLIPLAFSTCSDYSASVHDLVEDLGRHTAKMDREYLLAGEAGKLAIQAKETGRLRRHQPLIMQKAPAYRTLRCIGPQHLREC